MAVILNKVGINLNRAEREKVEENWRTIEGELSENQGAAKLAKLAELAAADAKLKVANVQSEIKANTLTATEAKNAADGAVEKVDNVQQQLTDLVVSGDSSPQATQASVGADGTSYGGNLKARLDAEFNATAGQLAETGDKIKDVSFGTFVQKDDISKMKSLMENNKPLKIAIVGDSTKAGVGYKFVGTEHGYAELGDIDKPTSFERFFLNMLMGSEYFIKPSKELGGSLAFWKKGQTTFYAGGTSTNWDRYVLTYGVPSGVGSVNLKFKHTVKKRNKLTVYYLKRDSTAGASGDVVSNGVTTTIDTHQPSKNFGSVIGVNQMGYALHSVTVDIDTTGDTFEVGINNIRAGIHATPNAVGTFNIVGFYYGEEVSMKNLAVRGTTLQNNPTVNQNKGVTTDGRLQSAYAYGANVFGIGWGTNDANGGIGNTSPDIFANELVTRVNEIRAQVPGAVIIFESAYPGTNSTGTTSNVPYFEKAKEKAIEHNFSFIDDANILLKYGKDDVINDYVHQNEYGYDVVAEAISHELGFLNTSTVSTKKTNESFLPSTGFRGALVRLNAAQPIPNDVNTIVTWNQAQEDTSGFFDPTNPTRIVIPAGVSKVRVKVNIGWMANATGGRVVEILLNGNRYFGHARSIVPATVYDTGTTQYAESFITSAGEGAYFEVRVKQNSGASLDIRQYEWTWFAIEVVE